MYPRIGSKAAANIKAAWDRARGARDGVLFLQKLGLPAPLAQRLIARHGGAAEQALREDPFSATKGLPGATFAVADSLARQLGAPTDLASRATAAITQACCLQIVLAGIESIIFLISFPARRRPFPLVHLR